MRIRNILLATDGSTMAERAADFAAALALPFEAAVTILFAHSPEVTYTAKRLGDFAAVQGLEAAEAAVAELAVRLHELGVATVDTEVIAGPAIQVILNLAEARQADLLVIGARGTNAWPGLGSVSMTVVQRANGPVLVVR